MLAQRLRYLVALQSQATSLDAYGGNVGTWSTYAQVWAAIEPISGTETLKAGQNVAQQMTRIVIRYRADVTAQHQIVHGSKIYRIVAPPTDRDTAHRWLEIMCTEGGPA